MKSATTPMVANCDLWSDEEPIKDAHEYRRIIGSLQYITLTRPDIQLVVNRLSQFMATPKPIHVSAMKRVLRSRRHLTLELPSTVTPTREEIRWTGRVERDFLSMLAGLWFRGYQGNKAL